MPRRPTSRTWQQLLYYYKERAREGWPAGWRATQAECLLTEMVGLAERLLTEMAGLAERLLTERTGQAERLLTEMAGLAERLLTKRAVPKRKSPPAFPHDWPACSFAQRPARQK